MDLGLIFSRHPTSLGVENRKDLKGRATFNRMVSVLKDIHEFFFMSHPKLFIALGALIGAGVAYLIVLINERSAEKSFPTDELVAALTENSQLQKQGLKQNQELTEKLSEAVEALKRFGRDPSKGIDQVEFHQALEDLSGGDPSKAEQIFERIASGKTTEGEAGNTEAAEAYNHLGWLTSIHDEQKSLEFFQRAAGLLDVGSIQQGIDSGSRQRTEEEAGRASVIGSTIEVIRILREQLLNALSPTWEKLRREGVLFAIDPREGNLEDLDRSVRQGTRTEETLLHVCLGADEPHPDRGPFFFFRINVAVVLEGSDLHHELPEGTLPIVFFIQRWKNDMAPRRSFPSTTTLLTQDQDGTLWLSEEHFRNREKTDLTQVIEHIQGIIIDEEAWEAAQHHSE